MPRTKTTLNKETRKDFPARGRGKRTLLLEGMEQDKSVHKALGLSGNPTKEDLEKAYYLVGVRRSLEGEEENKSMYFKMILERMFAAKKSTFDPVKFKLTGKTPSEKANQVISAASNGEMLPEIMAMFMNAISQMVKIEEVTDLRNEVDRIKAALKDRKNA